MNVWTVHAVLMPTVRTLLDLLIVNAKKDLKEMAQTVLVSYSYLFYSTDLLRE